MTIKKLIKILWKTVAVLFLLVITGVIAVTLFFDPNDYKDEIAAYVQERTGREFSIQGELSLSVFPWVGLEIAQVQLGNAIGFGQTPFARAEQMGLRVKLLPLLRREVVMDTVVLDGLRLHLIRNRQGRGNWEDLTAGGQQPEPSEEPGKPAVAAVDITGVKVSDARIEWEDRQTGQHAILEDLGLHTGRLGIGEPVEVGLAFDLRERPEARPRRVELSARVALDLGEQRLAVDDLALEALGLRVTADVTGTRLREAPQFKGIVAVREFVPRRLLQELEIDAPASADATVWGKAALETAFEATPTRVALSGLRARIDDTTLAGELAIDGFSAPAYRFDLQIDAIDIDRYLPPKPDKGTAPEGSAPGGEASAAPAGPLIPVDLLRSLNVDGALRIGKLKAYGIRSEQIQVNVNAKKGSVRIHPATARLYGGEYRGDLRIDARGTAPLVSMDESLTGVQAEPLFNDVGAGDWVAGSANLTAQLSAKGNELAAMRRSLRGLVTFSFTDGVIKGINVAHLIRVANATLQGKPKPPDEPKRTDFASMTGSAQVKDGVVHNRDLEIKSPLLRIEGSGRADLVKEHLDYRVKTVLVGTLAGQGGEGLARLKGVPIPVRLTGPFQKPKVRVELEQVLTETQKRRVEEKVEEKKQELEQRAREKLDKQLGDKLKDMFK